MDSRSLIQRVWFGSDGVAAAMRMVLMPAERLFGGVIGARDILYDAGWLPTHDTPIPAISVGNLTVGGTGKTPISAWIARGLVARGAHPAVVLRGYGDDEPLVHQTLNPDIPVILGAARADAVRSAAAGGADIAVLDDAFQHRRVRRIADIVLVSADQWTGDVRLLPAGPWREPLGALRRATLLIVTRKAASDATVDAVHEALAHAVRAVPRVSVRLALGELVRVNRDGDDGKAAAEGSPTRPLQSISGKAVRAILSIADPTAFIKQLEAIGATVHARTFADHHNFTTAEIQALAAGMAPDDVVVCTLKDAVKLGPTWPRLAPSLWYVSQRVMVERGVGGIERVLDDLVRMRSRTSPTAG